MEIPSSNSRMTVGRAHVLSLNPVNSTPYAFFFILKTEFKFSRDFVSAIQKDLLITLVV